MGARVDTEYSGIIYDKQSSKEYDEQLVHRFLTLGLDQGTIVICDVDSMTEVYARITPHKNAVTHVAEVKVRDVFVSVCSGNTLCVWRLENDQVTMLSEVNIFRPLKYLRSYSDRVVMGFKAGDIWMFSYHIDDRLECVMHSHKNDHDSGLNCLAIIPDNGFVATGSNDHTIKVWNTQKQVIREIVFPDKIEGVEFLDNAGSLVIGHNGKVSAIRHNDYHLYESPYSLTHIMSMFEEKPQNKRLANNELFEQLYRMDREYQKEKMKVQTKDAVGDRMRLHLKQIEVQESDRSDVTTLSKLGRSPDKHVTHHDHSGPCSSESSSCLAEEVVVSSPSRRAPKKGQKPRLDLTAQKSVKQSRKGSISPLRN